MRRGLADAGHECRNPPVDAAGFDGNPALHYVVGMMPHPTVATVTAKGQVTIRRSLLDHVGVRPGDQLEFIPLPDGRLEVRPAKGAGLESLRGILKRPGQRIVTIEEMNETIAKGWAGLLTFED